MEKPTEFITDQQLEHAFGNANFGAGRTKREILDNSLLKIACGYATGHTAMCIMVELGLITEDRKKDQVLTKRGKEYLWIVYSAGKSY